MHLPVRTLTRRAAHMGPVFQTLTAPAYKWMNETPSRVPLTDWYFTTDGQKRGFQARSVVGGLFIKMLADPAMWAKWRQ